jgi:dihydropyrimidinase
MKLDDKQVLDVLCASRQMGVTTMVHAENADIIEWMTSKLVERGMVEPWHHSTSRPQIVEDEATNRVIALAEVVDAPMLIVHVSSKTATSHIRAAQTRGLPLYAETCPHYALLTAEKMMEPSFQGCTLTPVPNMCALRLSVRIRVTIRGYGMDLLMALSLSSLRITLQQILRMTKASSADSSTIQQATLAAISAQFLTAFWYWYSYHAVVVRRGAQGSY